MRHRTCAERLVTIKNSSSRARQWNRRNSRSVSPSERPISQLTNPDSERAKPMSKIRISVLELQRRALSEVRKQPGCHNVQEIAINRVAVEHATNRSLCVMVAGVGLDANTAARAAVHVQSILRRDYDLLTD